MKRIATYGQNWRTQRQCWEKNGERKGSQIINLSGWYPAGVNPGEKPFLMMTHHGPIKGK